MLARPLDAELELAFDTPVARAVMSTSLRHDAKVIPSPL
jgi:hypothetical protein